MESESLLKYCISKSEAFIVCFNILDSQTFDKAIDKWIPLIKKYCRPTTKLIESEREKLAKAAEQKKNENQNKLQNDIIEEDPDGRLTSDYFI